MDDSLSDMAPYGTEREDADDHRIRILLARDRPALSTCLKSHTADAVWLLLILLFVNSKKENSI